ncbi:MAG: macrocin O-methyltransferase [Chitinophagaceae bacterium]|nr:MAG: macrocin O-methyltransferase [Chitinophagaceae bacterium]
MNLIDKVIEKLGYVRKDAAPTLGKDMSDDALFVRIAGRCQPFTMTSPERMYSLYQSVRYLIANKLSGSFVECGVWRGGSSMVMALTLQALHENTRELFLYDTYEGMSAPGAEDVDLNQNAAGQLLEKSEKSTESIIWAFASLNDVQQNLGSTGYPDGSIHYVQGKVEDTLPATLPGRIALLRLDTDWYESTYHELTHLFPLVVPGGVVIIDDYGHWQGARKAVDQYLNEQGLVPLLHRIDYTGRVFIKI